MEQKNAFTDFLLSMWIIIIAPLVFLSSVLGYIAFPKVKYLFLVIVLLIIYLWIVSTKYSLKNRRV